MTQILLLFLITCQAFCKEPRIGEVIDSSHTCYTITRSLGTGLFGKVFEATNLEGDFFALKWYLPHENFLKGMLNLYRDVEREYYIGQLLDHPNIIRSIETLEGHYNVLEFVKGENLTSLSRGALTNAEVFRLAYQLVSALKFALSYKLINRDLHAGNIMIDENNELKIIDLASFVSFEEIEVLTYVNDLTPHLIKNVDDIVAICLKIISKAKLPRATTIFFKSVIKKISWHCEANYNEGQPIILEMYLDEIINSLEFCFSSLETNASHH